MFPVSRLVTSMRYGLKDMQGAQYSDHELIEAINNAAALIYQRLGEKFSHVALKRTLMLMQDGQARLPSDFHNVYKVSVDGQDRDPATLKVCPVQYRIAADTFYAPGEAYVLEYYRMPQRVLDTSDVLDAPDSLRPFIETAALAILGGAVEGAEAAAAACVKAHAAAEFSHIPTATTTQILGGKL